MSRLDQVENLVRYLLEDGKEKPVLVVSAFQGVTNALLKAMDELEGSDFSDETLVAAFAPAVVIIHKVIDEFFSTKVGKRTAKNVVQTALETVFATLKLHGCGSHHLGRDTATYTVRDEVISFGEMTAAEVLKIFLAEKKVYAQLLNDIKSAPVKSGKTNKRALHRAMQAGIKDALASTRLHEKTSVVIIGGHIPGTPRGIEVDIGRNYSDTTAVNVAAVMARIAGIQKPVVNFWKDVDGLLTANDKELETGNDARLITHVHWREAHELSSAGSRLLQTDALILAEQENIALRVRNILDFSKPGTLYDSTEITTDQPFKSICDQPCDAIRFRCPDMVAQSGFIERFGKAFTEEDVSISDPLPEGASIMFTVPLPPGPANENARQEIRRKLERICDRMKKVEIDGEVYDVDVAWLQGTLGNVCIVGSELANQSGILSEITGVLAAYNINIFGIGHCDSQLRISFYVLEKLRRLAKNVLHAYFIDRNPETKTYVERRRKEIAGRY